jgi:hypothetical protein
MLYSKPDKFMYICGYNLLDLVQLRVHYIESVVRLTVNRALKIAYRMYIFSYVLSYHVAYEYFRLYQLTSYFLTSRNHKKNVHANQWAKKLIMGETYTHTHTSGESSPRSQAMQKSNCTIWH